MYKIMTKENIKKVEFAPGCFDDFEGTQEELEALQAEIMSMLTTMSPEELAENSSAVDFDELYLEDPELAEKLEKLLDKDLPRSLQ
jgi:hypothetical protein